METMETQPISLVSVKSILQLSDPNNGVLIMQKHGLSKNHPYGWEFPGGKVEIGEDLTVALSREIEEETGWIIDESDFLPVNDSPFVHDFIEKGKLIRHEVYFSVVKLGIIRLANSGVRLSDAHIGTRWVKPKEVKYYNLPAIHSKAYNFAFQSGLI